MTPGDLPRGHRAIEPRGARDGRFLPHTPLGPGREFDAIRRLLERWGPRARQIGDDGAVISGLGERAVVTSIDTSVHNVHFRRDWLTPADIGYRSAVSALSDLAAMGARPVGILAALTLPASWLPRLDQIGDGIGDAAELCNAPILGGDLTRGEVLSLTFSVLGTARAPLCRSAARPGDFIYVTGQLGGSASALRDFMGNRSPSAEALVRFARPVPRIEEAIWISDKGAKTAIDISDGLAADLAHVAAASKVSITVDMNMLPTFAGVPAEDAVRSGEEYELAVTSPLELDTGEFEERFQLPLTLVGRVSAGEASVVLVQDGAPIATPRPFAHFPPADPR
ncbi:MAG: thiamine-phosphate kinase [Gemmatimonadota bacterium]|nr:thiamine-phosphate kinase [Gemmatimonadota bacterium]